MHRGLEDKVLVDEIPRVPVFLLKAVILRMIESLGLFLELQRRYEETTTSGKV